MASVKLNNLTKEQANVIALLFEDETLVDAVNKAICDKYGDKVPPLDDNYEVRYDDNDIRDPENVVWFGN